MTGNMMVVNCIAIKPGANLGMSTVGQYKVSLTTYHIGGAQYLLIDAKLSV